MMRDIARRRAFTLVELLVVIGIIVVLAGLTALFFQPFSKSQQVSSCLERLQQALLVAKQTARRDNQPFGVRFLVSSDGICRELQFVRQRDDFAQGVYHGRVETAPFNVARVFSTSNLMDTNVFPIQAGDYFEVYGGGVLRRVVNRVNPNGGPPLPPLPPVEEDRDTNGNVIPNSYRIHLAPPPQQNPPAVPYFAQDYTGISLPDSPINPRFDGPTNYRIIPQPHPQDGEPTVKLPDDTGIDFITPGPAWNANSTLSNAPLRSVGGVVTPEIVFGPSGAVVGQGTTAGMIFLWVREARFFNGQVLPDVSGTGGQGLGRPRIVSVQTRTGFIAAHPVPSSGPPFRFASDGKASGM